MKTDRKALLKAAKWCDAKAQTIADILLNGTHTMRERDRLNDERCMLWRAACAMRDAAGEKD